MERMLSAGLAGFELGHRENLDAGHPHPSPALPRQRPDRHRVERLPRAGKPNLPGENTTDDEMVSRIIDRATGSAPVYP